MSEVNKVSIKLMYKPVGEKKEKSYVIKDINRGLEENDYKNIGVEISKILKEDVSGIHSVVEKTL